MASLQKKDQRKFCDALEVTDRTKNWTVIVQIVIKYPTREAQSGSNVLYKKYVLTDMKGTQISAITFAQSVAHLDRILQPFKRYYVTNAAVKVADPRYKIGEYNYTWTLSRGTHVQLIHDPIPYVLPCTFDFKKFSEMFRVADHDVPIDVKALVVHSYHINHATKPFVKEYILIDEEKRPMILRLWDDMFNEAESGISTKLPNPTLIVGLDLKVTTHNGLSLTTRHNAYFMVNPPLHQNDPLFAWYNEHTHEIGRLVREKAYKSADVLFSTPATTDIVPIKHVYTSMETLKTAWVAATIHLIPAQDSLYYSVCGKCNRSVDVPVGWRIPCTYCNEDMEVEPRCHVGVYLNDKSGTISGILFSSIAEKLINFSAAELMEAEEKNAPLNDEIAKRIDKKSVVCFLKYFDTSFKDKNERSYSILKLYAEEEVLQATTQSSTNLAESEIPPVLKECGSEDADIEHQLFSPTTKQVIEEITFTSSMDKGTMLSCTSTKRGIKFSGDSEEKDVLFAEKVMSPSHDYVIPTATAAVESPVKKLKNKDSGKHIDQRMLFLILKPCQVAFYLMHLSFTSFG